MNLKITTTALLVLTAVLIPNITSANTVSVTQKNGYVITGVKDEILDTNVSNLLDIPAKARTSIDLGGGNIWKYTTSAASLFSKKGYSGLIHNRSHSTTSIIGSSKGHDTAAAYNWSNAYSKGKKTYTHKAYYSSN
ncbi:MAG: hypothetical protein ACTIM0_10880 [Lactococcus cremoris]|nr:hypothetical protein FM106_23950 [Brachybacterium faecium]